MPWTGVPTQVRWILDAGIVSLLLPARLVAALDGPSARLEQFLPDLFPAGSLADAAVGGELGARLADTTATQAALGFRPGDVILASHGQPVAEPAWEQAFREAAPGPGLYVVWRTVPGERPVFPPAVIGSKVIDEFAALPDSLWEPMRLGVMLANQQTLVASGAGIVLVPATQRFEAEVWLRRANPLPRGSETALATVAAAIAKRTTAAPAGAEAELRQAEDYLERRAFLEAAERARRAMVESVVAPESRSDPTILVQATRVLLRARELEKERRQRLLRTEPNFAIVLEGQVGGIQAFLPQKTLLTVDKSNAGAFLAGVRVRVPVDTPVLSDFFLLVEYGYMKYRFDDPSTGAAVLTTTIQQLGIELLYRPRLASRLKPFIRGGVGIFPWTGKVSCSDAIAIDELDPGLLFGGGLDFLHLPSLHLRASVAGSYRILHTKFVFEDWPLLDSCTDPDVPIKDGFFYDFDLDGWQVGLMLTVEL